MKLLFRFFRNWFRNCRLRLSKDRWKKCRQYGVVIKTVCYLSSASWVATEMISHFLPTFGEWSRGNLSMLFSIIGSGLLIGILRFLCEYGKMLSVRHNIKGTDISVEIRVDDIFNNEGALIISTNTTFDNTEDIISKDSLQGKFTDKYYDKIEHLDSDLESKLNDQYKHKHKLIQDKEKGKRKRYDIGTVVKLNPKEKVTYFVAIADMNEHGNAAGSFEEIIESLGKLWLYIGEQGELGSLVIPVLGTGRARINITREEMTREIIKSFIAACSEKKFCEKLTIVIYEKDYREHDIDLQELGNYLRCLCQYTDLKKGSDPGRGEALDVNED